MNCSCVLDHLSAYIDGELATSMRDDVQQHIDHCESCANEVASFRQLGELVSSFGEPPIPPPNWEQFSQRVNCPVAIATDATRQHRPPGRHPIVWIAGIGALVALAASLMLVAGWRTPLINDHDSMVRPSDAVTLNLQPVLEGFRTATSSAVSHLTSQFVSQDVTMHQAEVSFGRPTYVNMAAHEQMLPGDATITSTKLLSFPYCNCPRGQCTCGPNGCNCVVSVCERPDGSSYLVLENCISQPISFGDLKVELVQREGREVKQVTVDGTRSITFDRPTGGVTVTVVGLRDEAEIQTLLASN